MEKWQLEIQRLNKIREELGLNFSQLEKKTGMQRELLGRYFKFESAPGLKAYLTLKEVLESEYAIKFPIEMIVVDKPRSNGMSEISTITKIPKEKFGREKSVESVSDLKIIGKNECDCKLEGGLLKRGKIKCKKTKEQHNF